MQTFTKILWFNLKKAIWTRLLELEIKLQYGSLDST